MKFRHWLVFAILLLFSIAYAPCAWSQPTQPPNVQLTTTVMWDLLPATLCEAPCTYEVSLDGTALITGLTVGTYTFPKPGPGLHVVEIVAVDGQMRRSAVSSKSYTETAGALLNPCTYQAPIPNAPMETRPIGQMMQGFNPIGASGTVNNQAARLQQLMAWGWVLALSQFVEGNLRPDKTDRLFLIVTCRGLP